MYSRIFAPFADSRNDLTTQKIVKYNWWIVIFDNAVLIAILLCNLVCRINERQTEALPGYNAEEIFVPNTDELATKWWHSQSDTLREFYKYSTTDIINVMNLVTMKWVGYMASVCVKEKCMQNFHSETWKKKTRLKT